MTTQQKKDISMKELWPLTPPDARPPLGHGDGSDDMTAQRGLTEVDQKKKKHGEKEKDDDKNI